MLIANTKFARRKDPVVATSLPEPTKSEEKSHAVDSGQSPTGSESAEAVVVQKRLEESFNIDSSVDLKPSLAQRQDDRYHSFSKFLKRPNIRALNTGLTARVSRILENASRMSRIVQPNDDSEDDSVPGTLSMTGEEKWKLRKQSMKDEIYALKSRVVELERTHGSSDLRSYKIDVPEVDLRKPGEGIDGLLTELTLLRRENYALRNLTDEELEIRNREVCNDLRTQVAQLEKENAQLQRKLNEHRDNHLLSKRPPIDIVDLNNIKRMPLDISNVEKDRVYKALDEEWKYATSISRHGSSEPLQGPFERRRFINK